MKIFCIQSDPIIGMTLFSYMKWQVGALYSFSLKLSPFNTIPDDYLHPKREKKLHYILTAFG